MFRNLFEGSTLVSHSSFAMPSWMCSLSARRSIRKHWVMEDFVGWLCDRFHTSLAYLSQSPVLDFTMKNVLCMLRIKPMLIKPWEPGEPFEKKLSDISIWVKLHNVPSESWDKRVFTGNGKFLGKPNLSILTVSHTIGRGWITLGFVLS